MEGGGQLPQTCTAHPQSTRHRSSVSTARLRGTKGAGRGSASSRSLPAAARAVPAQQLPSHSFAFFVNSPLGNVQEPILAMLLKRHHSAPTAGDRASHQALPCRHRVLPRHTPRRQPLAEPEQGHGDMPPNTTAPVPRTAETRLAPSPPTASLTIHRTPCHPSPLTIPLAIHRTPRHPPQEQCQSGMAPNKAEGSCLCLEAAPINPIAHPSCPAQGSACFFPGTPELSPSLC